MNTLDKPFSMLSPQQLRYSEHYQFCCFSCFPEADKDAIKTEAAAATQPADQSGDSCDEDTPTEGCTLFVKNLNFITDDDKLKQVKRFLCSS